MGDLEDIAEGASSLPENVAKKLSQGVPTPRFLSENKKAAATEIGTATHVFLQFADFDRLRTKGAQAELERLKEKRFM